MLGAGSLACLKLGSERNGKRIVDRPFVIQVRFTFSIRFGLLRIVCRLCCWSLRCSSPRAPWIICGRKEGYRL